MWTKRSVWPHLILAGYMWLIGWIPLGDWNRQNDPPLLTLLLRGNGISSDEIGQLLFVTMPAVLYWLAWRVHRFCFAVGAVTVDVAWLWMQIQSWWIPYIFGATAAWQLRYASGPTTKVLPSFGNHVSPDGMHLMIHVLLVPALLAGVYGLRELRCTLRPTNEPAVLT